MARERARVSPRRSTDSPDPAPAGRELPPIVDVLAEMGATLREELRTEFNSVLEKVIQELRALKPNDTQREQVGPTGAGGDTNPTATIDLANADNQAPGHGGPGRAAAARDRDDQKTPKPARKWMKVGSAAWNSLRVESLRDYARLKRDHNALEDILMDFEEWTRHQGVPEEYQFRVFLNCVPELERKGLINSYGGKYTGEDYALLRETILKGTGRRDAVYFYLARLIFPAFAIQSDAPCDLRAHFTSTQRKFERALERTNRLVRLDDEVLAQAYLDALPRDCQAYVNRGLAGKNPLQ